MFLSFLLLSFCLFQYFFRIVIFWLIFRLIVFSWFEWLSFYYRFYYCCYCKPFFSFLGGSYFGYWFSFYFDVVIVVIAVGCLMVD